MALSYTPGSEAWRLNREAMLLLGAGPRALLLQLAHPLVAEGVDQHSDFQRDPWGRLRATVRSYLALVYGTPTRQRSEIERLNRLHRVVRGSVRDPLARRLAGERYGARDPYLSMWVHATLIESTIAVYDAWIAPLPRERKERFYAETRPIARAFGIPAKLIPTDLQAFEAYWQAAIAEDGPIRVTATARRLARTILHPPLGPLPTALYDWTLWPAIALLPARFRRDYGIPWGPLQAAVTSWLVGGYRAWRPLIPTWLRWMPQALAADRRQAGVSGQSWDGAPDGAVVRGS